MDFSFLGKLTAQQQANANLILNECESYSLLLGQTAYVLATAWHESKFKPVEEIGKGKGKPYGSKIKYSGKPYYTPDDFICVWEGEVKTNFASQRDEATHKAVEKLFKFSFRFQIKILLNSGLRQYLH